METQLELKGGIMSGETASRFVRNILHADKQVKSRCIDLTLKEVYILEGPGSMDFSGKECECSPA
jgi:hypothetical protein